jgi:hypothetical protein
MPNGSGDFGQGLSVLVSQIQVTGISGSPNIVDNFTEAALDPTVWTVAAAEPADVALIPNNIAFALSWTLPDLHFNLEVAPSLGGPWTNPNLTNTVTVGATKTVLVPKTTLPSTHASYFRMVKPVFSQLQILLPGETAAPGTPTGKTGTPTLEPLNAGFNITVNAVDEHWNIVPTATDTIAITSTDTAAVLPPNAALASGTVTFNGSFQFSTPGTWTITATDVTAANIPPAVSAPVVTQ